MSEAVSTLFMATVAPGLESVAESEIVAKINGAWHYRTFRGRILFGCSSSAKEWLRLRCVDNVYAHVAWLQVGPYKADLRTLGETVAKLDLAPALAHLSVETTPPAIFVSASRSGKHSYSRFDAAEAVSAALQGAHGYTAGDASDHDIGFRLDIMDEDALLSVKLTPPSFRFRGAERRFSPAALRPTVAHALVWLSKPRRTDVFLDPFCGSGTIVAERASYAARRLIASDRAPEAVAAARTNVWEGVEVYTRDARELDLDDGEVTSIVTNPPWGNQISPGEDIAELYRGFLREAGRVLAPGGKITLITDQAKAIEGASRRLGMPCTLLHTISLHGLTPAIYRIG